MKFHNIKKSILQAIKACKENKPSDDSLDSDNNILVNVDDNDDAVPPAEASNSTDDGDACFMVDPSINLSCHALLNFISTEPVISKTCAPQPTPVQQLVSSVPNWDW